ncbi:hypothetical protein AGMMS49983_19420 [Clostridia bacterium]|nr:hypothetical protein AGMMS49983_19420 [Clostridia bacterium]
MKYVIEFSKTGRMAYISHLDLSRAFLRALRMTGLQPAYSQGFNPHPKMSIALPLSLGQSSVCELIEIETREDQERLFFAEAVNLLNDRLPDGIRVLTMREKPDAFSKPLASYVRAAEYEILCDGIFDANARMAAFFERVHIPVLKTSKKTGQTAEKDIRPDMLSFSVKNELHGWLLCRVTLRAEGGAVLSPRTFFDAFAGTVRNTPTITRIAIFGDGGEMLAGRAR